MSGVNFRVQKGDKIVQYVRIDSQETPEWVCVAVRGDGPAAQQGIRYGDILVGMHKWETVSLDNIAYILDSDEFRRTQPIKFYILRDDETLYGHMTVSVIGD